jgi:phosphopantothenoylcysteine synthetase/decarboxylase
MQTETNILNKKNAALISENNRKMQEHEILNEAVEILRPYIKTYVFNKISSNELPNIHGK